MNFHTFGIIASLYIMFVTSAPANNKVLSVYDALVQLGNDEKYKCPYLRNTSLITPEPDFLKLCFIPEGVVNDNTAYNPMMAPYILCMVYMESFKRMCAVEPKLPANESATFFSNSLLNGILPVEETCTSLKKNKPTELEFTLAFNMMTDGNVCKNLCLGLGNQTLKICEWSAYLLNFAVSIEAKQSPNKPTITEEASRDVHQNNAPAKTIENNQLQLNNVLDQETNQKEGLNNEKIQSAQPKDSKVVNSQGDNPSKVSAEAQVDLKNVQPVKSDIEQTLGDGKEVTVNGNKVNAENTVTENNMKVQGSAAIEINEKDQGEINAPSAETKPEEETSVDVPVKVSPPTKEMVNEKEQTLPQIPEAGNIDLDENEDSKKAVNLAYDDEEEDDGDYSVIDNAKASKPLEKSKPLELEDDKANFPNSYSNQNIEEDDSYFFSYFMMICIVFILGYVGYHNKQKILAIVLEGRKGKRQQRRRPNSANYHKLDSNLEEAVTSACNKNTANIIY